MRSLLLWAFASSMGCAEPWDLPADLIPVSQRAGVGEAEWGGVVSRAAGRWNEALVLVGCAPQFDVSLTGHEGHLVLLTADPVYHEPGSRTLAAETELEPDGNMYVYLHDPDRWERIVTHELGHALGLDHTEQDAGGVMTPVVTKNTAPSATEITLAAELIGCK